MRILHLEDSAEKHINICRVLSGIGETDITWVTCVNDGMEKITETMNKRTPFGLVISDMHYPVEKHGREVKDAGEIFIGQLSKEKINIPVIICSTVKYRIKEAYCCIKYSEFSDWEKELQEAIRKWQKEIYTVQQKG